MLATDSLVPSGVGEHMLALARELSGNWDVVLASDPRAWLGRRALRAGLAAIDFDASDTASLAEALERLRPDILHVHAGIGWEGHDLAAVGRRAGIAAILRTEHLPFVLTDPTEIAVHRRAVHDLDAVVCVSRTAAESFVAAGVDPNLIHAIANGVHPRPPGRSRADSRRNLGIAPEATVVLVVARLTEQKGHAVLLDALAADRPSVPGFVCLIAGDGPLRMPLERQARTAGLGQTVRFLGERDDVADLMAAADCLVLPSLFEGLPLVVLEAMAAGLPVVATLIGGTSEAVDDGVTGWLAEPGDAAALAATLRSALADPVALARAGAAGRERFEAKFRASAMAEATADLYRRLAGSTHAETQDAHMKTIRIGFVGVGGIAQRHLGILEHFDDVAIVGFADPDRARAEAAAVRFGARAFDDASAMMDACDLDAVYICVPPFAHGAPEQAAIERGLPFFVEKPVSLDLATAEAIAAAVAEKGLVTAVGYHWRYLDTVDEARALLAGNPPQLLSGYWLDSTPPPQWWWREDRSGGQMVEQATHLLDLARFLVGDVVQVYGRAAHKDRPEFPDLDVPTTTTASLTFASGVVANLASTCLLGWNHRVGLHIFADKLAIELTDHDIMVDVGRGRPVRGADGDPVWREDRDFIDAVAGLENRIRCPYADALATHRLALAVVESARTGEVVSLPPDAAPRVDPAPLRFLPRPEPGQLPPGHRHVRSLGIERPGEAYHFQYEEGPPGEGQVRLDTLYSGFSAGTELTFFKNTNPYLHSRWDGGRGVFVPGEPGQHFPLPFLGYMEVARVAESRAAGFRPGEIVASTYAHKSGHTADPFHDLLVSLPATIDPMLGIYVAQMGPIAANGLLHADAELAGPRVERLGQSVAGRPVLVIGGGVVGLLTALFAAKAGASEIVVADPSSFRRGRIEALGFTAMDEDQAWNHAKATWHHGGGDRGADFVFQTRADARSLHAALRALRPQGTVIDLAFYQGGADAVRLGEEFHHNGLAIRCAQIGRVPRGLGFEWNRRRLAAETIELLAARGPDIIDHMITHVVDFEEAPAFLRHLVEERPDFLQVVFKVRD
ncbi:glycosyl transferase family 1 [Aureimonas endophytica]|uniref:Glycosyl transferase family 1 n=1 Tax=Aureimonas endophytica TaxID=2027858 RepID=A0A916ZLH2_9HYPH|nr:glycosyltransferase [Aureimonas endophytica]GGE03524.1 glycosyl transferase family 1 [Aureimonas endophytica]